MPAKLRFLLIPALAVCALLVPATGASAASCEGAGLTPSSANKKQIRHAVLCLLNQERAQHGLDRLHEDRKLRRAAKGHSRNMVQNGFFDHVAPSGATMVDRVRRAGYMAPGKAWSLGENIAWGTGHLATPEATVRAWMKSPGHRANILRGDYREIGIGISLGAPVGLRAAEAGATYTTNFGRLS
jgi:uncharacterized protein YkwD